MLNSSCCSFRSKSASRTIERKKLVWASWIFLYDHFLIVLVRIKCFLLIFDVLTISILGGGRGPGPPRWSGVVLVKWTNTLYGIWWASSWAPHIRWVLSHSITVWSRQYVRLPYANLSLADGFADGFTKALERQRADSSCRVLCFFHHDRAGVSWKCLKVFKLTSAIGRTLQ